MINLKLIYKIIGSLLFIEAMMLLLCLGVSVYYHEDDLMADWCCDCLRATATTLFHDAMPILW